MAQLSPQTLVAVIQALDAERERLALAQEEAEGPQVADLDEILLSYDTAAEELKQAYLAALDVYDNLPPYEDLVCE